MDHLKSPNKHFEEIKRIDENGVEYWNARELMLLIDYSNWQNFEKVIKKAMIACKKSKRISKNHLIILKMSLRGVHATWKSCSRLLHFVRNDTCTKHTKISFSRYR